MSPTLDLAAVQGFAEDLARQAGKMIKDASDSRWTSKGASGSDTELNSADKDASHLRWTSTGASVIDTKLNSSDVVTQTDRNVEVFCIAAIKKAYPGHAFIGEESYAAGKKAQLSSEPTWIVDPIDGTASFAHGFPHVCVSIGFVVDRQPTIGVVFNPFLDLLYSGVIEAKLQGYRALYTESKDAPMTQGFRSIGSAALSYCYVAAGQLDGFFDIGAYCWDVCAGMVIAQEAGGRCFGRGGRLLDADGEVLMGRHHFVLRGISDSKEEQGEEIQSRIARDFFSRVPMWDV